VAKDKKKKTKSKQGAGAAGKAAQSFKSIAQNPLVADLVAAALVSTAAALKDSKKARQLAGQAEEELTALAKEGAEKGNAMWQLALEVGRRAIDTLAGEDKVKAAKAVKSPTKSQKKWTKKAKPAGTRSKAN
jgi:hypothetical protein